ncbi:MAG: hypothetical protein JXP73_15110 [Deltaproteobacteria bacterium]|nr:hypothetical protein [Deltaproteobacteria bacterium]
MIRELGTGVLAVLLGMLRPRAALLAENALLHRQLIVLRRAAPHPRLKSRDRLAVAWISRVVPALLDAVTIVPWKPWFAGIAKPAARLARRGVTVTGRLACADHGAQAIIGSHIRTCIAETFQAKSCDGVLAADR